MPKPEVGSERKAQLFSDRGGDPATHGHDWTVSAWSAPSGQLHGSELATNAELLNEEQAEKSLALIRSLAAQFEKVQLVRAVPELKVSVEEIVRSLSASRPVGCIQVQVDTMAHDVLEWLRPIQIVVQPCEDEFVATYFDGEISSTGQTQVEAVANVKDLIVRQFVKLNGISDSRLGLKMRRRKSVLAKIIVKRDR